MTIIANDVREERIRKEREFYLDPRNLLDFVRDFGAAPDAEEDPHGAGLAWMDQWDVIVRDNDGKPLYKSKLVLWPRGSFKSQVFTVGYSAWRIAKNPDIRIFIASETGRQARKFVANVMKIIDSPKFRELFGVHKGNDWNKFGFISQLRTMTHLKEPTLAGFGVGEVQTGAHWDLGFLDDVVSQENTKTPEAIVVMNDWVGDVMAQLDPGSQLAVVGTHHHHADLYSRIKKEPDLRKGFQITSHGWKSAENKLFFPRRLTPEFIDRQKAIMTPRLFSCFYENRPASEDQQLFLPQYFRIIRDAEVPRSVWTFVLTDFAFTSNNDNDRCCFWAISLDANRVAYVRECLIGRWKPGDSIRVLIDMWNRWLRFDVKGATVEAGAHDELIKGLAEEVRRQTMTRIRFIPIQGRSQEIKNMRIEGIEPRFRRGDIYFCESFRETNHRMYLAMLNEMTEWPFSQHDDVPDAISDLDKKDQKGHYYCPSPPIGWAPVPQQKYTPSLIDGKYNSAMVVDPREMLKRMGMTGAANNDLYTPKTGPLGSDLFGRRQKPI